jgi:hypothetical protein
MRIDDVLWTSVGRQMYDRSTTEEGTVGFCTSISEVQ